MVRISDCNNSIRLWNDLNEKNGASEMLLKVKNAIKNLTEYQEELSKRFPIESLTTK